MKPLLTLASLLLVASCSSPPSPARKPAVNLEVADVQLARRFLDSLYRPGRSPWRVIADAASDPDYNSGVPLPERNRELRGRLARIRTAMHPVRIALRSSDRPPPYGSGSWLFLYDRRDGSLKANGPDDHKLSVSNEPYLRMSVVHWSGGTRVLNVFYSGLNDGRDNYFHLEKGEAIFRFAAAAPPIID